jgi:hypothetical protein
MTDRNGDRVVVCWQAEQAVDTGVGPGATQLGPKHTATETESAERGAEMVKELNSGNTDEHTVGHYTEPAPEWLLKKERDIIEGTLSKEQGDG